MLVLCGDFQNKSQEVELKQNYSNAVDLLFFFAEKEFITSCIIHPAGVKFKVIGQEGPVASLWIKNVAFLPIFRERWRLLFFIFLAKNISE